MGAPAVPPCDCLSFFFRFVQRASGSGRSWILIAFGRDPLLPSLWKNVRVPVVVLSALPFQPAFGSSMRPSTFLANMPIGYGVAQSDELAVRQRIDRIVEVAHGNR